MVMSNGQLATKVVGDASFVAKLTEGTILQFTLSGKLGGTINGLPISGSGHLEYTFRAGGTAWELASDGLAQGPALPAGALVYTPSNASGSAAVSTTGTVVSAAPFTSLKDRYNFKLKGRVSTITVAVFEDTPACDTLGVDGNTDCSAPPYNVTPQCQADCQAIKDLFG